MQRHKIGLYTGGVSGMKPICDILQIGIDPISTFQEYTDIVGVDLNGQPIEAGFATATWTWEIMPQSDFDRLLEFANARVVIRTRHNSGASGFDFGNYYAYCSRPTAEVDGLIRRGVEMKFIALIPV